MSQLWTLMTQVTADDHGEHRIYTVQARSTESMEFEGRLSPHFMDPQKTWCFLFYHHETIVHLKKRSQHVNTST